MVRIAPVRLTYNPKVLWFDAGDFELAKGDHVVVTTVRGTEFGTMDKDVFEMEYEQVKKLKSPLKPVKRKASDEDVARAAELAELSQQALPIFRQIANEVLPDMNPVAVEYLLEGDKAVFYFDAEERVDFRDLVRNLASELHVRVDMKQIGVRDGARMVGGLGHCGQELCCRRLGGEFNPVSIRMAKEQDLSLNPQKISGVCGRLMCCLRYEYDAYKDFHSRAPKKNAKITTPDGEGKIVDMNVPREIISIKVGDDKPVKVPLADMEPAEEGARPTVVGQDAWDRANAPAEIDRASALSLFSSSLSGEDKLAEPGKVRRVHDEADEGKSRSRRRSGSGRGKSQRAAQDAASGDNQTQTRRSRRRRSTTVASDGSARTEKKPGGNEQAEQKGASAKQGGQQQKSSSSRRRRRSSSKQQAQKGAQPASENTGKTSQVGRNSSALRAGRRANADAASAPKQQDGASSSRAGQSSRRRRRSHRTGSAE